MPIEENAAALKEKVGARKKTGRSFSRPVSWILESLDVLRRRYKWKEKLRSKLRRLRVRLDRLRGRHKLVRLRLRLIGLVGTIVVETCPSVCRR